MSKHVVIVGAAGNMTSVATAALLKRFPQYTFTVCDYNYDALVRTHGDHASDSVQLH